MTINKATTKKMSLVLETNSIDEFVKFYEKYTETEDAGLESGIDFVERIGEYYRQNKLDIDTIKKDISNVTYPEYGDKVSMSFYPSSQRHIEYYNQYNCEGVVIYVDGMFDNNNNGDNFIIITPDSRLVSYKRDGSHYMSMADCYIGDFIINK
jgi:hypothetical protein